MKKLASIYFSGGATMKPDPHASKSYFEVAN
jgi:hypothetical protein